MLILFGSYYLTVKMCFIYFCQPLPLSFFSFFLTYSTFPPVLLSLLFYFLAPLLSLVPCRNTRVMSLSCILYVPYLHVLSFVPCLLVFSCGVTMHLTWLTLDATNVNRLKYNYLKSLRSLALDWERKSSEYSLLRIRLVVVPSIFTCILFLFLFLLSFVVLLSQIQI